jgi:hypothetical protein
MRHVGRMARQEWPLGGGVGDVPPMPAALSRLSSSVYSSRPLGAWGALVADFL